MSDAVIAAHADGVGRITLNVPGRRNALDVTAMRALSEQLWRLADREDVRCIVIAGAAGSFSAGADLSDGDLPGRHENSVMMDASRDVIAGIARAPVPVVAQVEGPAAGIGASIALACDLVVASSSAYFLLPFVGLGLVPDGGATLTVAASVGRAQAMRLALLQEPLPATEALAAGLITQVCEPGELDLAVSHVAAKLAAGPPRALAATKRAINEHVIGGLGDALERETRAQLRLLDGPEFREGIAAFRERRPPDFGRGAPARHVEAVGGQRPWPSNLVERGDIQPLGGDDSRPST